MFNARGLVCGRVNGAWRKFAAQARLIYLESKSVNFHIMKGWLNSARYGWARANGFGEGRGPTWPFGMHDVDGGV
jgi:hypothetical protein